jgi:hypothetical protein
MRSECVSWLSSSSTQHRRLYRNMQRHKTRRWPRRWQRASERRVVRRPGAARAGVFVMAGAIVGNCAGDDSTIASKGPPDEQTRGASHALARCLLNCPPWLRRLGRTGGWRWKPERGKHERRRSERQQFPIGSRGQLEQLAIKLEQLAIGSRGQLAIELEQLAIGRRGQLWRVPRRGQPNRPPERQRSGLERDHL